MAARCTLADAPKRNGKIEGASVRIDLPMGDRTRRRVDGREADAERRPPSKPQAPRRAEEEEGVTHGV